MDTPAPVQPEDDLHRATIVHNRIGGTNDITCWVRDSANAPWRVLRQFSQRFADPIIIDPDWAADGEYRGRHPIKMPTATDLLAKPDDDRTLAEQQDGIRIGRLGAPPPVPFNFPNAAGTPGYKPPPGG